MLLMNIMDWGKGEESGLCEGGGGMGPLLSSKKESLKTLLGTSL